MTMKRLIIILLSISGIINAQQYNTLEELDINGNVKSLLYSEFDAIDKFGKPVKGEIGYVDKSIFDENGYKTQIITYGKDGNPFKREVFEYNDYGYISTRVSSRFRYSRARNNKPYKHVYAYKYNNKKNIIEDNLLKNDSGEHFKGRNIYVYDGKGNVIKKTSYNFAEEVSGIRKYVYDFNGNLIERIIVEGEGSFHRNEKSYPSRKKYKYDSFNKIIESTIYNSYTGNVESVESWKYEKYDERNNWVKAIVYENHIPKFIIEKEIEYYK